MLRKEKITPYQPPGTLSSAGQPLLQLFAFLAILPWTFYVPKLTLSPDCLLLHP